MTDAYTAVGGPAIEATDQMLETAADDPCMPVRNLGGHLITCNYGDWASFDKCECADGLAGVPDKPPTHVNVAPMPMRDCFAMSIDISDEAARDLATGIKVGQMRRRKIETIETAEDAQLTVVDIAEARARLRYLEADAMVHWRGESLRQQAAAADAHAKAEAEREAHPLIAVDTTGGECVCGDGPDRHKPDQPRVEGGKILGGMCDDCSCKGYLSAESPDATEAEPA